jgi:TrpR-related protein YerC/YecD
MAKRRVYEVDQKERYAMLNDFFNMVVKLKTAKDAANFFKDLLTPSESLMLIRRIAIAKMLLEGWNFEDIRKKLKVGYNTISSVNRWLHSGFGGYLNEIGKIKNKKELRQRVPDSEWQRIKKRYPAHFLLFNIIDNFKKKK